MTDLLHGFGRDGKFWGHFMPSFSCLAQARDHWLMKDPMELFCGHWYISTKDLETQDVMYYHIFGLDERMKNFPYPNHKVGRDLEFFHSYHWTCSGNYHCFMDFLAPLSADSLIQDHYELGLYLNFSLLLLDFVPETILILVSQVLNPSPS